MSSPIYVCGPKAFAPVELLICMRFFTKNSVRKNSRKAPKGNHSCLPTDQIYQNSLLFFRISRTIDFFSPH